MNVCMNDLRRQRSDKLRVSPSEHGTTARLLGLLALALLLTACPVSAQHSVITGANTWEARVLDDPARAPQLLRDVPDTLELVADGVTREEAVLIALIRNAHLQAQFERLGIAAADLAQAGFYSNPELGAVLRFPESESGHDLEVELSWNVADLWRVPLRKKVAQAEAQCITLEVAGEVLRTIADARRGHDECVVLAAVRDRAHSVIEAAKGYRDQVYTRYDYGYANELTRNQADAALAEAELELVDAAAALNMALVRMHRILGLPQSQELEILGAVPEPPTPEANREALTAFALTTRPDMQAARLGIARGQANVALQRRSVWRHVTVGSAYAHDPDGTDLWGAALGLELPLVDKNRAQRRRADASLERARQDVAALQAHVGEEVALALEDLTAACEKEWILRHGIIPARQRGLQFTEKYYNEMQLSMLPVLEARRELFEAQKRHLMALAAALAARVELELALGGRYPQQAPTQ